MKAILTTTLALAMFGVTSEPLLAAERARASGGGRAAAASAPARSANPARATAPRISAPRVTAPRVDARASMNAARPSPQIARTSAPTRAAAPARIDHAARTAPSRDTAQVLRNPSRTTEISRAEVAARQTEARRNFVANRANDRRDWDGDRRRDWDRQDVADRYRSWERYRYYNAPLNVYRSWDRNRTYSWNNHRYHWHGGSWVIVDPGYAYVETTTLPAIAGNVVVEVQAQLERAGYDPGPVDGVMGGQTRAAIAQYQADRGLAVTGRIDSRLLASLGIN